MGHSAKVFEPSHYAAGNAHGLLVRSSPAPGRCRQASGSTPQFRALPTDIVFDKDVAVTLRDGVTIYVDVLRPAGDEQVPVIVAWSPYGKSQGTAPSVTALFTMLGIDNGIPVRAGEVRGARPGVLVRAGLRDLQSRSPRHRPTPKATARCSDAKKVRTAMT